MWLQTLAGLDMIRYCLNYVGDDVCVSIKLIYFEFYLSTLFQESTVSSKTLVLGSILEETTQPRDTEHRFTSGAFRPLRAFPKTYLMHLKSGKLFTNFQEVTVTVQREYFTKFPLEESLIKLEIYFILIHLSALVSSSLVLVYNQ